MLELSIPETEISPEVQPTVKYEDTVLLPLTDGEYMHVETSQKRLSESFGDFAARFGHDRTEAIEFYNQHAKFEFSEVRSVELFDRKAPNVLRRAVIAIKRGKPVGVVGPERNGKHTVCIDTQAIAEVLPKSKNPGCRLRGYSRMTTEQKIAAFTQLVTSNMFHEFFHLIQNMTEPEMIPRALNQELKSYVVLLGFSATAAVMNLFPELRLGIIPMAIPVAWLVMRLNKSSLEIEQQAYSAQRDMLNKNLRSPFTFVHESSKGSA